MESTYDYTGAAIGLTQIADKRTSNPHSSLQLINLFEGDHDAVNIKVATYGGLGRLIDDSGGEAEEVVVALRGIICRKDLPPVTDKISKSKVRFLRQGISLTALGESYMDRIFAKVAEVQGIFQRTFGDRLQECSVFSTFKNYTALDLSNRYFMTREDAPDDVVCDLGPDVDPQGILTKLADSSFVHTMDNKVYYFERRNSGKDGDYTFEKVQPAVFQLGDIVEVQASFVALPQRENKVKLSLILRSISLLDKGFTQDSLAKKIAAIARVGPSEVRKTTLKRKVGYSDEHVSVTRARFTGMEIEEGA